VTWTSHFFDKQLFIEHVAVLLVIQHKLKKCKSKKRRSKSEEAVNDLKAKPKPEHTEKKQSPVK